MEMVHISINLGPLFNSDFLIGLSMMQGSGLLLQHFVNIVYPIVSLVPVAFALLWQGTSVDLRRLPF